MTPREHALSLLKTMGVRRAARTAGVRHSSLHRWARAAGVPLREPTPPHPMREAALRRMADGEVPWAVAKSLGVRLANVYAWLDQEAKRHGR